MLSPSRWGTYAARAISRRDEGCRAVVVANGVMNAAQDVTKRRQAQILDITAIALDLNSRLYCCSILLRGCQSMNIMMFFKIVMCLLFLRVWSRRIAIARQEVILW